MAGEIPKKAIDGKDCLRVLICEDEFLVARGIRQMVEELGHQVAGTASDGASCLAMAEELRPDVVLMDIGIPGIDGIETTRQLMAKRGVPIIMATAYDEDEGIYAALQAGASAYLTKPLSTAQLGVTLRVALARFREIQQSRQEGPRFLKALAGDETQADTKREPKSLVVNAEYFPERSAIGLTVVTEEGPEIHLMERIVEEDLLRSLREYLDDIGCSAVKHSEKRDLAAETSASIRDDIRETLQRLGSFAATRLLHYRARKILEPQARGHLWLTYSPLPILGAIPWELLKVGDDFLCRRFWLSRSPRIAGTPESELEAGEKRDYLDVLVISDPTRTLPMARHECERIADYFRAPELGRYSRVRLLNTANMTEILAEMDGRDIVHFAGHAYYNQEKPQLSGWVLRLSDDGTQPKRVLSSSEFLNLNSPPKLVFSNACSSAREEVQPLHTCPTIYDRNAAGLAQAFMEGGIQAYVGTMWAIPDSEPTIAFARAFYESLLSGGTAAQAVWNARQKILEVWGESELAWASYLLFGKPTARL